jgi:hypothetical protein
MRGRQVNAHACAETFLIETKRQRKEIASRLSVSLATSPSSNCAISCSVAQKWSPSCWANANVASASYSSARIVPLNSNADSALAADMYAMGQKLT